MKDPSGLQFLEAKSFISISTANGDPPAARTQKLFVLGAAPAWAWSAEFRPV